MEPVSRHWTDAERREVLFIALLPLLGAILLTLLVSAAIPAMWFSVFFISVVCAYGSTFIGVVPILLLFKRFNQRSWFHYAIAGFLGVLLLWLIPILTLSGFERSIGSFAGPLGGTVAFLMLPAAIASVGSVVFWSFCVRQEQVNNGI